MSQRDPNFTKRFPSWQSFGMNQLFPYYKALSYYTAYSLPQFWIWDNTAPPWAFSTNGITLAIYFSPYALLAGERAIIQISQPIQRTHKSVSPVFRATKTYLGPISTVQYWTHNLNIPIGNDFITSNKRYSPTGFSPKPLFVRSSVTA